MEPNATCYEREIPVFAEQALDRLHGSLYASLRHLHLGGDTRDASTWVRGSAKDPASVLLYRVEGRVVRVLTHVIELPGTHVNEFADFIFARYPGVAKILFPALALDMPQVARPHYTRIYREDVVLDPAPVLEVYQKQLGKGVRRELRRSESRLLRDFPDFEMQVYDETDFNEADAREILALSRARIEDKSETWYYSPREVDEIIGLLRQRSMICVARIDGRICAGQICYRFGDSFTFKACGYDARYAPYSMGFYMCYLGLVEALRRNAQRIHFGFLVYDYKLWLGGRARRLDRVILYRSRLQQLADCPVNFADYCGLRQRTLRERARKISQGKGRLAQCLRMLRPVLRGAKRVRAMLPMRPG